MLVAIDENGARVFASDDTTRDVRYRCPVCKGEVRLRRGEVNAPHFAHTEQCSDDFNYDMSDWHREWQERFPAEYREVVIEAHGEKHRADVHLYDTVIEFQHSKITSEEFWRRTRFYHDAGKRVVWIFDMREMLDTGRLQRRDEWRRKGDNGCTFNWSSHWRMFDNFIPRDEQGVMLFFQLADYSEEEISDAYMEQVVWVPDDLKNRWRTFRTSYGICNKFELLSFLEEKWESKMNHVCTPPRCFY